MANQSSVPDTNAYREILSVLRKFNTTGEKYTSSKAHPSKIGQYVNTNSIYTADELSPVWWLDNGTLNVHPAVTASDTLDLRYIPNYTVTNWDQSNGTIAGFKDEYYEHIIIYASMQYIVKRLHEYTGLPTAVNEFFLTSVPPDIPSISELSYKEVASSPDVVAGTVSTTSYTAPSNSLSFASRLIDYVVPSFNLSVSAPTANLSTPNITVDNILAPGMVDINNNVPTYNSGSVVGFAGLFANLAEKTIASLPTIGTVPTAPTLSQVVYTPPSAVTQDGIMEYTTASITVSDAAISSQGSASNSTVPVYNEATPPSLPDLSARFAKLTTFVDTEEDPEMANTVVSEINANLNEYQQKMAKYQSQIQQNLNTFNDANVEFQADVRFETDFIQATNTKNLQNMQKDLQIAQANQQASMADAQRKTQSKQAKASADASMAQQKALQDSIETTKALIADNSRQIQYWQNELSSYTSETNAEIQRYQANLQKEQGLWQSTQANIFTQHSQQMQDNLNLFNEKNVKYQADIQSRISHNNDLLAAATKNSELNMQEKIQNYNLDLSRWSQEVSSYQASVNAEVQEYQADVQNEIQTWQTKQGNALQRYQMEQQDEISRVQTQNDNLLKQAQIDLQAAIRNSDKGLELKIQNSLNTMQAVLQDNQTVIAKYQADIGLWQQEVAANVQEQNVKFQKHQADLSKAQVQYQWYQEQYARLAQEYERLFMQSKAA